MDRIPGGSGSLWIEQLPENQIRLAIVFYIEYHRRNSADHLFRLQSGLRKHLHQHRLGDYRHSRTD